MAWSDIFGYLFTRRANKTPNRSRQVNQINQAMQPGEKGTDYREKGLVTQVTPWLLPYDRYNQRWQRKKLLEEVNEYVHTDPRLARANEKKAQKAIGQGITVTVQGEQGRSRAAKVGRAAQEIINQVIRDTKMNAKLESWARLLLREGELDLNVIVDQQNRRIVKIQRLPTITIMRNEDENGEFPDLDRAFTQVDPLTQLPMKDPATGTERHFPLYALNSVRYLYDDGELYGVPAYAPGLRYAQMLRDIEDQMFIRRMVRAGLKWLFQIMRADGSPSDEADVKRFKDLNPLLEDPEHIKNAVRENIYSNTLTKVEAVQGDAKLDEIKDVEFVQEQLWVAAETPKGLLGYGEQINRDVLDEQQDEYNKDLDHLCFLLEHGDGGPYSGLRAIFDFALAIQGINPAEISYAIQWTEHTKETKEDRSQYVLALRQERLISKRKALHLLSNDLGLESEADIDAMLDELEEEAEKNRPPGLTGGPVPGDGKGRFMTPEDLQSKEDAPEEALSAERGRLKRRLRDRNRRVWRRVQEHPELHSLLESLAAHSQRVQTLGVPVAVTTAAPKDEACDCGHHHREPVVMVDDGDLPANTPYLVALILSILRKERLDTLKAVYLAAARKGAKEAVDLANEWLVRHPEALAKVEGALKGLGMTGKGEARKLAFRSLPANLVGDITEGIETRWEGIDATTEQYVRAAVRQAFEAGADVDAWEAAIQQVLEMPDARQQMIADTEAAWSYHQGAIDVFTQVGMERLRRNELPTACPECAADAGSIYGVEEASAILPAHPSCYGWWSPAD